MGGAENFIMNVHSICEDIYTFTCRACCGCETPVAYIVVKLGPEFKFSDSDLICEFDKMKWNSPISTADLLLEHDEKMSEVFKIKEIRGFEDDSGYEKIYRVEGVQ